MLKLEPGAVLCRVAPSFLRFAHFELFWRRGEMEELRQVVSAPNVPRADAWVRGALPPRCVRSRVPHLPPHDARAR